MNAILAHYHKVCEQEPATTFTEVAKKRFLFLTVPYKKDSSLPPQKRLMRFIAQLTHKGDASTYWLDEYVRVGRRPPSSREGASVSLGK